MSMRDNLQILCLFCISDENAMSEARRSAGDFAQK